jgi:hypothetical protein
MPSPGPYLTTAIAATKPEEVAATVVLLALIGDEKATEPLAGEYYELCHG